MDYKDFIKMEFGINEQDQNKEEFLEIIKCFFTLYSMYEESFRLRNNSLNLNKIKQKIINANRNIRDIDELNEHFYNRYTRYPDKKQGLFRSNELSFENEFENHLKKDQSLEVSNIEKQIFLGMIANRYRNRTLHGTKEYKRWYEYKDEFEVINKYLYLWLKY